MAACVACIVALRLAVAHSSGLVYPDHQNFRLQQGSIGQSFLPATQYDTWQPQILQRQALPRQALPQQFLQQRPPQQHFLQRQAVQPPSSAFLAQEQDADAVLHQQLQQLEMQMQQQQQVQQHWQQQQGLQQQQQQDPMQQQEQMQQDSEQMFRDFQGQQLQPPPFGQQHQQLNSHWRQQFTLPSDAAPGAIYSFVAADGGTRKFVVPRGYGPGSPILVTY
eukprot:CAMPEP_0179307660 /NCGR_PEP_ID=MMETSP0797-20121207/50754_1 /TAXON_ID=47934 /ORGANISM="Dinophysis acuminata, Strain DAEP01" /LENGTH=220 /DNA_ID=CAMNT_0021017347 /DNA_START=23 /DNA_END=685 /DNA_ORIENTATION=+